MVKPINDLLINNLPRATTVEKDPNLTKSKSTAYVVTTRTQEQITNNQHVSLLR